MMLILVFITYRSEPNNSEAPLTTMSACLRIHSLLHITVLFIPPNSAILHALCLHAISVLPAIIGVRDGEFRR